MQHATHGLYALPTRHILQTLLLLVHGPRDPQTPRTNLLGRLSGLPPRRDLLRAHPMVPRLGPSNRTPTNHGLHVNLPPSQLHPTGLPIRLTSTHPGLLPNHLGRGNAIMSLPPRPLSQNHPRKYLQSLRLPLRQSRPLPTSHFFLLHHHRATPFHPPPRPHANRNIPPGPTRPNPTNRPAFQMPRLADFHRRRGMYQTDRQTVYLGSSVYAVLCYYECQCA